MKLNMDRLFEAVAERGHVCVGLDTAADYVPEKERRAAASDAEAVLSYNKAIVDATIDIAACYKVQIAYYEELGIAGLKAYAQTLKYIREKNSLAIADIKRGDIADTASRYAKAHFDGEFEADFVTLTPYLGMDSIEPWFQWVEKKGKGAFVLMLTSNKGRQDFEELALEAAAQGTEKKLYDAVGEKLSLLAADNLGKSGYAAFGAVIGADPKSPEEREKILKIRETYSKLFFLIPGYGAQGGAAEDAALLLKDGNGGVVNASRSIIKAWASFGEKSNADYAFVAAKAREASISMRDAIKSAAN